MDPVDNPYAPGAGLRPPLLAGRDAELETFDTVLHRGELGRPSRGLVLTGLRGVGKTVLLNELANRAEARGWIVARLEVRPDGAQGLLSNLSTALTAGIRGQRGSKLSAAARRALDSIKAFSVTVDAAGPVSASVEIAPTAGSGDLEIDFTTLAVDVGRAVLAAGSGAVIFVDEMQELDKRTMASLAAAAHAAGQRSVPFTIVGAGLPNLPAQLADAKSYAERLFDYRPLGRLSGVTAAEALAAPASAIGVEWTGDALESVVTAADGYPYFLQEFGAATWKAAAGPRIIARDAVNGIREGQVILDSGFFRSRWDRATPSERLYLRAMAADDGGPSRSAEIASRVHRTIGSVGPLRAGLIGKGLIYAPEYGSIAFTVPGMAGFITRQVE